VLIIESSLLYSYNNPQRRTSKYSCSRSVEACFNLERLEVLALSAVERKNVEKNCI
jgi:hypothetical protein